MLKLYLEGLACVPGYLVDILLDEPLVSVPVILCCLTVSYAVYTMARRRGIPCSWLAWVPVLGFGIYGALSDQYRLAWGKRDRKLRIFLPLVWGLLLAAVLPWFCLFVQNMLFAGGIFHKNPMNRTYTELVRYLKPLSVALWLLFLLLRQLALTDILNAAHPGGNGIPVFASFALAPMDGHFLFHYRKMDDGMPQNCKTKV